MIPTKRVLIADDEPELAEMMANSLARLGSEYAFEVVYDGVSALQHLQQSEYALLITDYHMPEMNGLDLAQRAHQLQPDMQVILMTAHGTSELRNTVKDGLADDYIEKPFSVSEIREIVRRAVDQTHQKISAHSPEERPAEPVLLKHLQELLSNTGARCVLLINVDGFPIEAVGARESLDVTGVSALVAANFIAATELANLLGNQSVFKSSYHEGSEYNIYAYYVNKSTLLVVVFGAESKTGAIWFYTKQTATALMDVLAVQTVPLARSYQDAQAAQKENPALARPLPEAAEREAAINDGFDSLFGGDPTQDAPLALLSFEEAVNAGLIPGVDPGRKK